MTEKKPLEVFAERVGYSDSDLSCFSESDPRIRQVERLPQAAPHFSIVARVVRSRHCNSGYRPGDAFVLDVDGNFISKLCPKRMCVYAISQFVVPVALINERFSEGLDPNGFHFMHQVHCLDVGVECKGYGQVLFDLQAVPRPEVKSP